MDSTVIVMIVMLALPNGEESLSVKPMESVAACRAEAQIEASDPYVAHVECSELTDGVLHLSFKKPQQRKIPEAVVERSTG